MPQVYADQDEHDSADEEADDFDCFYSYLLDREQNQSARKDDNQRPSLSSSTATDSSNEDTGIWKTLGDAKKKQQDIRKRLQQNGGSSKAPRQEQALEPDYGYDEDIKPDSDKDLRPEDVVRMVVRKASIAAGVIPMKSASSIQPQRKSATPNSRPPPSAKSSSSSLAKTPSRPISSSGDSDSDSFEENPKTPIDTQSESSDEEYEPQSSIIKGAIPSSVETDTGAAPPSKWKKSTANIHTTNFAGIVTPVKKASSRRSSDSENSEMTGITQFFDAFQMEDDILAMDEDEYQSYRQKQEQKKTPEPEPEQDFLSPNQNRGRLSKIPEFPLVKPLPFIPPTFEKKEEEEEEEYDPEYEFQRLYVDDDEDQSFDKEYYDKMYGEYNDDRDPEERERERRQKELEARRRGEAESEDEASDEEEEDEERGLVGTVFNSVLSVGFSLGHSLFGGGKEEEEEKEEGEEDGGEDSGHKRKAAAATSPKNESIFSGWTKKAKNPPKIGAPPPSRELEIIKKCQQQYKVRELEAAEREAKQKELDKENLKMRRDEERERVRVKREVDEYRAMMIEMGKGDKLAKDLKKAKDEYEDRLAMEETLKQQQQKAEEMQERLQEVDKGKEKDKKKKKDDDDSNASSEMEARCCCAVM